MRYHHLIGVIIELICFALEEIILQNVFTAILNDYFQRFSNLIFFSSIHIHCGLHFLSLQLTLSKILWFWFTFLTELFDSNLILFKAFWSLLITLGCVFTFKNGFIEFCLNKSFWVVLFQFIFICYFCYCYLVHFWLITFKFIYF